MKNWCHMILIKLIALWRSICFLYCLHLLHWKNECWWACYALETILYKFYNICKFLFMISFWGSFSLNVEFNHVIKTLLIKNACFLVWERNTFKIMTAYLKKWANCNTLKVIICGIGLLKILLLEILLFP